MLFTNLYLFFISLFLVFVRTSNATMWGKWCELFSYF